MLKVVLVPRMDTLGSLMNLLRDVFGRQDECEFVIADFGGSDHVRETGRFWADAAFEGRYTRREMPEHRCCNRSVYTKQLLFDGLHALHPGRGSLAYDVVVVGSLTFAAWLKAQAELEFWQTKFKAIYAPPIVAHVPWPAYSMFVTNPDMMPSPALVALEQVGAMAADRVLMESETIVRRLQDARMPVRLPKAVYERMGVLHLGVEGTDEARPKPAIATGLLYAGYPDGKSTPAWSLDVMNRLGMRYGNIDGLNMYGESRDRHLVYGGLNWTDRVPREQWLRMLDASPRGFMLAASTGDAYCTRMWEGIRYGLLPIVLRGTMEDMLPDSYPFVYDDREAEARMLTALCTNESFVRMSYDRWVGPLQELVRREHDRAANRRRLVQELRQAMEARIAATRFGPYGDFAAAVTDRYAVGDQETEGVLHARISARTKSEDPLDGKGYATPNWVRALLRAAGWDWQGEDVWKRVR